MSLTIPNNFVEKYDAGQKKLVASELDANFDAVETAVNSKADDNAVVHLAGAETVTGDKTFSGTVNVVTPASSDDSTKPATTEWVRENAPSVPVGTIIWSANATVPAGYLLCNGSAVGRETYPELFDAIGTTFGSGDGSTTFNLPNLIDKFIEGGNVAGTAYQAGAPEIYGQIGFSRNGGNLGCVNSNTTGAFKQGSTTTTIVSTSNTGSTAYATTANFLASRSSSVYGASNTVQPPAVTALPCIKAFSSVIGDATVVAGQLVNEIQSKVALDGSNTSSIGSVLSTYMAHAAMPSDQYINLTLPASGGTVTAPADGWIFFNKASTATNQYVELKITGLQTTEWSSSSGQNLTVFLPVKQGDIVGLEYTAAGTLKWFLFIYANGSAPTV